RWGVQVLGAPPVFAAARGMLGHPRFLDWFLRRVVEGPDMPPDDARLLREDFQRASLPVLRGLARGLVRADFPALLRVRATPALVLVAATDPVVYAAKVERLGTLMPQARVVVRQGLAHGWTADAVAEQNRLLAQFLDGEPIYGG